MAVRPLHGGEVSRAFKSPSRRCSTSKSAWFTGRRGNTALQKIHDYVWELIEQYGEWPIPRRIAEIDAKALNSRPRTVFDPPRRQFLRKYFNVPLENVRKFPEWREYLYLNVLGFPLSPFTSRTGLRKSRSLQTLRDWCCENQDDHSKQH